MYRWFCVMVVGILMGVPFVWGGEGSNPTFQEVATKALAYARLEVDSIVDWQKKVRKAALLPRLQFGFDRGLKNNMNMNLEDTVAVNSSGITVGPTQQKQIQNADRKMDFEVKAVWFLDQLLFSKEHLDISQEARGLSRERQYILDLVRQNYFKRQRLEKEIELLKVKSPSSLERDLKKIEMAEAASVLDGLTGGWFSNQLGGGL